MLPFYRKAFQTIIEPPPGYDFFTLTGGNGDIWVGQAVDNITDKNSVAIIYRPGAANPYTIMTTPEGFTHAYAWLVSGSKIFANVWNMPAFVYSGWYSDYLTGESTIFPGPAAHPFVNAWDIEGMIGCGDLLTAVLTEHIPFSYQNGELHYLGDGVHFTELTAAGLNRGVLYAIHKGFAVGKAWAESGSRGPYYPIIKNCATGVTTIIPIPAGYYEAEFRGIFNGKISGFANHNSGGGQECDGLFYENGAYTQFVSPPSGYPALWFDWIVGHSVAARLIIGSEFVGQGLIYDTNRNKLLGINGTDPVFQKLWPFKAYNNIMPCFSLETVASFPAKTALISLGRGTLPSWATDFSNPNWYVPPGWSHDVGTDIWQNNDQRVLGGELWVNGDMSNGTTGYGSLRGNIAAVTDPTYGHALELTLTSAPNCRAYNAVDLDYVTKLGHFYQFGVYKKSGTSGNDSFIIQFRDDTGLYNWFVSGTSAADWQQTIIKGPVLATIAQSFYLYKYSAIAGSMLWANISVKELDIRSLINPQPADYTKSAAADLKVVAGGGTGVFARMDNPLAPTHYLLLGVQQGQVYFLKFINGLCTVLIPPTAVPYADWRTAQIKFTDSTHAQAWYYGSQVGSTTFDVATVGSGGFGGTLLTGSCQAKSLVLS